MKTVSASDKKIETLLNDPSITLEEISEVVARLQKGLNQSVLALGLRKSFQLQLGAVDCSKTKDSLRKIIDQLSDEIALSENDAMILKRVQYNPKLWSVFKDFVTYPGKDSSKTAVPIYPELEYKLVDDEWKVFPAALIWE